MKIIGLFHRGNVEKNSCTYEEAIEKVKEGREAVLNCHGDLSVLHCRGCINTCLLTKPRCEFGERIAAAVVRGEK